MSPKSQSLPDYDSLMKLLDHCGSAVSQKEVMGPGHPSPTNDITVSFIGSSQHWNSACYPITLVWF
jgi:hypothetical protein